jgi:hypothetical protein
MTVAGAEFESIVVCIKKSVANPRDGYSYDYSVVAGTNSQSGTAIGESSLDAILLTLNRIADATAILLKASGGSVDPSGVWYDLQQHISPDI